MEDTTVASSKKLLIFNCHEAWVYQLSHLDYKIDIIDGLPGRCCSSWDTRIRPIPKNGKLISLEEALRSSNTYECMIGHNITDLLDLRSLAGPRILVFHSTLEHLVRQQGLKMSPDQLKHMIRSYLDSVGGHAVAVSVLKGRSWGIKEIIPFGVDISQYRPWSGSVAAGVRISNHISKRKETLLWDFHEAAFHNLPVRLIGNNPDMPGVIPSRDWNDLKEALSYYRFYIHTAHPELEDGYNMAMLEAMAAGLPVLGNKHPTSPVVHGVSGFLSDDPRELEQYAWLLLQNRELAGRLGEAARRTVAERFSIENFANRFRESIETAKLRWKERKVSDRYFSGGSRGENDLNGSLKGNKYVADCVAFEREMTAFEIERAVSILDAIMQRLDMDRNICIGSIEEMLQLVTRVGDRLKELGEPQAADILLKSTLKLEAALRNQSR